MKKSLGLILIALALALAALGVYAPWPRTTIVERPPTAADLAACAATMEVSFPQGTRGVMMRYVTGGMDDTIYLRIEMDSSALDAFLSNSPFANIELSGTENSMYPDRGSLWWDVDGMATFLSGVIGLPEACVLRILINTEPGDVLTVYLEWNET